MGEHLYKELLTAVLEYGDPRDDRTGVGTYAVFGVYIPYTEEQFPLFTAKKVDFKNIASELLWFISGSTNVRDLSMLKTGKPNSKTIWDDNAFAPYWKDKARFHGDVGKIYGEQWRNWNGVDQLKELEYGLKNNPNGRRHILQSYSPDQSTSASIPACHTTAQFYATNDGRLMCSFYMRSNDLLLGHPYNIASYSLLTHMLAHVCGYDYGGVVFMGGDCHIYKNHLEAVEKYLASPISDIKPELEILGSHSTLSDFTMDSFNIKNYHPGPVITAPMAV